MAAKKKKADPTIHIHEMQAGVVSFCVLGESPFIANKLSAKAAHQLLMPKKKTAAERNQSLKHDPINEFRNSFYRNIRDDAPTLIQHVASAFKGAMMGAALEIPGVKRTQIGRLVWVEKDRVDLYGIPEIFMAITRSADMNKTPDVRTRAIIPHWACRINVRYAIPQLTDKAVANLLAAAGQIQGVGDWRPEKGSGNYGRFQLVSEKNKDFKRIMETGGRGAQLEAIEDPIPHDDETEDMLGWFADEIVNRNLNVAGYDRFRRDEVAAE